MALFKRSKIETPTEQPKEERSYSLPGLNFPTPYGFSSSQALTLDTVYCAVNQISNSIASLPIGIYKLEGKRKIELTNNQLYQLFNVSPDGIHSHFSFMKIMMESLILRGNAYAYIERDEQLNCKRLVYIKEEWVKPMLQTDGTVKYLVNGLSQAVDSADMIHLYMHLDDTFRGISVLRYALSSLKGVKAAEDQASSFFSSGQNVSGIINAASPLNNDQKEQIRSSWNSAFNSENKSGIAVLPAGLSYTQIAIDPKDGQLLESREFNVLTVARWFNIPPSKLFEMSQVSYNSMEFSQLEYLQTTIAPYANLIQDEFNRKVFKPSQVGKMKINFDFAALMNSNKESEASYYKSMIVNGVMSLNEVREKLNLEPVDEKIGDVHWLQLSYASAEQIASGAYVKSNAQNQQNDNKVIDNDDNKQAKQDKE